MRMELLHIYTRQYAEITSLKISLFNDLRPIEIVVPYMGRVVLIIANTMENNKSSYMNAN